MIATTASAIRAYVAEHERVPADFESLGFEPGYLSGTYFEEEMFSFTLNNISPLEFTITCVNTDLDPQVITLDQDGTWTEKNEE